MSKGMAEDVANSYKDKLPIVIIRPSIITCVIDDMHKGWVDGISSGATGIMAGTMTGKNKNLFNKK
jgi:alcohol-forming fatty acyl-CoA reductase